MQIRQAKTSDPRILAFLAEHLAEMRAITPAGLVHALAPVDLRDSDLSLWAAWENGRPVACGALRALGRGRGEIKAMRVAPGHRGAGLGGRILGQLLAEARRRGYRCLLLETGAGEAFARARSFYLRHGFTPCAAFGDYPAHPGSAFLKRDLRVSAAPTPPCPRQD